MKNKLFFMATILPVLFIFGNLGYAQASTKNQLIGTCVAGIQVSLNRYKFPIAQIPLSSRQMFLKYSERVGDMAEKVFAQCKQIDSDCVRRTIKNPNDFEIMDEYFKTMGAAMDGLDKNRLYALANTSCYLLSEQK